MSGVYWTMCIYYTELNTECYIIYYTIYVIYYTIVLFIIFIYRGVQARTCFDLCLYIWIYDTKKGSHVDYLLNHN